MVKRYAHLSEAHTAGVEGLTGGFWCAVAANLNFDAILLEQENDYVDSHLE